MQISKKPSSINYPNQAKMILCKGQCIILDRQEQANQIIKNPQQIPFTLTPKKQMSLKKRRKRNLYKNLLGGNRLLSKQARLDMTSQTMLIAKFQILME